MGWRFNPNKTRHSLAVAVLTQKFNPNKTRHSLAVAVLTLKNTKGKYIGVLCLVFSSVLAPIGADTPTQIHLCQLRCQYMAYIQLLLNFQAYSVYTL